MTIVESVMRELDPIIDQLGWNQPPRLYLVLADEINKPRLSEAPGFSHVATVLRPPTAVAMVVRALAGHTPQNPNTYGWLVVSETWSVIGEDTTSADFYRLNQLARQGQLASAPESELMRTSLLISYVGEMAMMIRRRNGQRVLMVEEGDTHFTGRLPDAMRLLVKRQ